MSSIRRLEDINLRETKLREDYYKYFLNGEIKKAHQLIIDNPSLNFKVLNSNNLNILIESILQLENNYFINVDSLLDRYSIKYQIGIDDLIYLKQYRNNFQYEVNNFVIYNKEIYFCYKKPKIGVLPSNEEYWIYLGLKGKNGYKKLGINYLGLWDKNITYKKYDSIVYNNKLYVSKDTNINKIPDSNISNWSLQVITDSSKILVSEIEPPTIKEQNIWFQIVK